MCKRFNFDNLISLIGAWLILFITLGLYYLIWTIFEYIYQKKYSIGRKFKTILIESLQELKPRYWWRC